MSYLKELSNPLSIKEIDFRAQSLIKAKTGDIFAILLAYKNARVDMSRLDEVVGPAGWAKEHKHIDGRVYCGIGINVKEQDATVDAKREWVWKWDVGEEAKMCKEKSEVSDSFKRAGFCWGIGRELYKYPKIFIKLLPEEYYIDGTKAKQTNKLLKDWRWEISFKGGEVDSMVGKDNKGNIRFKYNKPN